MTLRLNGDGSGFTEIKAPDTAGDNTITLPTSNGGANQLLKNGGTAGELQFASDVYIDSSNRLLVGHSSSSGSGEIQSANASGENISVFRFSANGGSPDMSFNKSRNATLGEHTLLNDGDALGQLAFRGSDGTTYRTGASIQARVQGTPGASNMPSFLGFYTNSGSSTAREVLRITAAGAIKLVDSTGIDFSDIQTNSAGMDSETLNGYETGSFTPTVGGHSGMGTITYKNSGTYGRYVRVGHYVTIMGQVHVDIKSSNPSGNFRIRGLPFAPFNNNPESRGIGVITTEDGGVDYVHLCLRGAFIDGNGLVGTAVTLKSSASNDNGFVEPSGASFINNDFKARFSLTYRIA